MVVIGKVFLGYVVIETKSMHSVLFMKHLDEASDFFVTWTRAMGENAM